MHQLRGPLQHASLALALIVASGCETTYRAPVVERTPAPVVTASTPAQKSEAATPSSTSTPAPVTAPAETTPGAPVTPGARANASDAADPRPEQHQVQKGDTLFSIALAYGLDYRELADWNVIGEPYLIKPGQQLRLRPPTDTVTVTPIKSDQPVEAKPLEPEPLPAPTSTPTPTPAPSGATEAGKTATAPAADKDDNSFKPAVKSAPKAMKFPYSEETLVRLMVDAEASTSATGAAKPAAKEPKLEVKPAPQKPAAETDGIAWTWPTAGKVSEPFSEGSKGVGITGNIGQPVFASAPGQVSYVGNSLRGYGRMVVIKHNKMYLTVYAHNSRVLVSEGQNVARGQKIAEMGSTDANRAKLHFEIRRYGKPVDPLRYLPSDHAS